MGPRRTMRKIVDRLVGWAGLMAAVGGAGMSCSTSAPRGPAGLEMIIAADGLTAPADFDDIKLEITEPTANGSNKLWSRDYVVPSQEATLPSAFTLLAGAHTEEVLISVTAFKGAQPVVVRLAQVQVPTDRLADLWLVLAQRCEGLVTAVDAAGEVHSTCPSGESCQPSGPSAGHCGPNAISLSTLPTYSPGENFDAGVATDADATTRREAGSAAGIASDASSMDMTSDATREEDASSTLGPPDSSLEGGACSNLCRSGQTACVSGGLASCALGSNGCWAYAPPVACPSVRQACTGPEGTAACQCNVDPVCGSLTTACVNASTLATCAKDSQGCSYEASSSACGVSTTCLDGGCGGVCGPTETQCSGNTPQTCASGLWVNGTACSSSTTCIGGSCGGVCGPGQTRCSFNGVQTCATGAWSAAVGCAASTPNCSAAACGQPPSCQATGSGLTNCGANSESCCTSNAVPGGTFDRTYTNTGSGPTAEADPATVSAFRLDKYDVTVGRFRRFVAAWNGGSGFTPSAGSGKHSHLNGGQGLANGASPGTYETGWIVSDNSNVAPTNSNLSDATCDPTSAHTYATWTNAAGSNENLPINCVNWFESYAFCIWDGGFLPSKAEWEFAAAGGSQQREYPWGTTDPGTSNQYAIYGCLYPSGSGTCTGTASIAPVGAATLGAGVWGQLDLAGNVWQWNLDWDATYPNPCTDCGDLTAVMYREVEGGLFSGTTTGLIPSNRYDNAPTSRLNNVGFRCARSP
jgi:sulfatase modifying factor 1